ncbi:hypothetical protein CCP4SC76_6240011 [Gammaproteobacteria bacterium]
MRMKTTTTGEQAVQRAILQYLALCPHVAWAQRFNTGATGWSYTTQAGASKRRFIRFGFTGCADILGQMNSGHLIAIECKRKGGKATDSQQAFLQTVSDNNGLAIIAMDVGDVEIALSTFIKSRESPAVTTPGPL